MPAYQRTILITILTLTLGLLATAVALHIQNGPMRAMEVATLFVIAAGIQYLLMAAWSKRIDHAIQQARDAGLRITRMDPKSAGAEPESLTMLMNSAETAFADVVRKERTAIENAADVICIIATDGSILSSNPASKEVWGYRPSELIGRKITEFIVGADAHDSMNAFLGAEESIDRIMFENRFRRKNGAEIDILWSAHWSVSDQGLFCIAHDITERKRSERLLKASEERIRLILESLPAGVAVINNGGYVQFMNLTAKRMIDSADEHLQAKDIFESLKGQFSLNEFIGSAGGGNSDSRIVTASGLRIPCEMSVRPIEWEGAAACLAIFIDVTDKHAVEQAKRQLVAMVSHDLRTPLTSIRFVLDFLAEGHGGELTPKGKGLAVKASQQSERMAALVNDLLDLEKMKSGKFTMNIIETSMMDLVNKATQVVEHSASVQGAQIKVSGEEVICLCDGARIIQVLVNLLDNAIKFTEAGHSIEVSVASQNGQVSITVFNRGRLIPEEKLDAIFESFEQAKPGESIERKGTGLGLAICRTIVEQHGGKIWAESSSEMGTRFTFTLEAKPDKEQP